MEISLKTPAKVQEIIKQFQLSGKEIYIVGGVVRDIMLDRALYDWDFTTNATPEEMQAIFPDAFYDNKFGTVGIPGSKDERPFEITTFRSEEGYSDSRHPDKISWGKTLQEDLQRRDFTINAMALKPLKANKFEAIDMFGGMDDIKAGVIKTVGDPNQRFAEDALRMMRAVRIATQLRFAIEEATFDAIQKNAENLRQISAERVRDELLKILASSYPADGYLLLRNCGLGKIILPEMEQAFGVEQKSPGRHHIYDVGTHSVEALRMCPSTDPVTRLATLVHDVGKIKTQRVYPDGRITFYNHEMESEKIAKDIAERLRFSNEQKDRFVRLVRWHQFTVDENQTDSAIRRFIRNTGRENVHEMLALRTGDRLGGGARETSWRLEEFKKRLISVQKQPFAIPDLKVSGNDVMRAKNIPSGPMVGKYLQVLFDEVTEKNLPNEKEKLLRKLDEINL
jgi:tRNA nucleotidyltransferase (CCA-adding enzyme)